jgi:hypothetical protein
MKTDPRATFGQVASAYAEARPRYPKALFEWLASQCQRHELAWDCATGNGQAATALAPLFRQVSATDNSAAQIANALPLANVSYSVAPADRSGLADGSVDLITVAQALHWFDYATFWPEARRVAAPGALFAAWGYVWPEVSGEIGAILLEPVRARIASFWAPNNRILWNGFRSEDIRFPFARMTPPPFEMTVTWSRDQIIAYAETWSAWRLALEDAPTVKALAAILSDARARIPADALFTVRMPLIMAVGRVT